VAAPLGSLSLVYEELPIRELPPGTQVPGIYRGDKFHTIEDPRHGPIEMGRVFLETADGPMAVGGNDSVLAQLRALNLADGDQIIIARPSPDVYHLIREAPIPVHSRVRDS
jgi:hypothetical protein